MSKFLPAVFAILAALPAFASSPLDDKTNQVGAIISYSSGENNIRQLIAVAGALQQVVNEHEGRNDLQRSVYPLESEAAGAVNRLQMMGQVSFDKTIGGGVASLVALIPQFGGTLSGLTNAGVAFTPGGNAPLIDSAPDSVRALASMVSDLAKRDDYVGTVMKAKFEELTGVPFWSNLNATDGVRYARELESQGDLNLLINQYAGQMNAKLQELFELHKQAQAAAGDAAAQELAKQKEAAKRQEIRTLVNRVGEAGANVANLIGEPQAGETIGALTELTLLAMEYFEATTAYGQAGAYVGAANVLMQLMSKNSQEDGVMRQLRAILELLQKIRGEMHDRFDRVDARLENILNRMNSGFDRLRDQNEDLMEAIDAVEILIQNFKTEMSQDMTSLYERYQADEILSCINERYEVNRRLSAGSFDNCMLRINKNVNQYSHFNYDSLSTPSVDLAHLQFESFDFPFLSYLPQAISLLDGQYEAPVSTAGLVNAMVWQRHSQSLRQIWTNYPRYTVRPGDLSIRDAIATGETIRSTYASLALTRTDERPRVNVNLFAKILADYKEAIAQTIIYTDAHSNTNALGIHTHRLPSQAIDDAGLPVQAIKDVRACPGTNVFSLAKYEEFRDPMSGIISHHLVDHLLTIPEKLSQWENAYKALPAEAHWLEKLDDESITICIRRYSFNEIYNESEWRTAANISIELEAYSGGILFAKSALNRIIYNTAKADDYRRYPALMFERYWTGDIPPDTNLDFDGISKRDFAPDVWTTVPEGMAVMTQILQAKMDEYATHEAFAINHDDANFGAIRRSVSLARNLLIFLIQEGIDDGVPQKLLLGQAFYDGDDSAVIRSAERMVEQAASLRLNGDDYMAQIDAASNRMIELLREVNSSGIDPTPRNAVVEHELYQLRLLLRGPATATTP